MAKFTKSEDILVNQSIRYTDGVPGTPPNKLEDGTYQQFGTGSNLLQVFLPEQGFDLLYKNPNMNEGSTEITQDLDKRFKLGTYTLTTKILPKSIVMTRPSLSCFSIPIPYLTSCTFFFEKTKVPE